MWAKTPGHTPSSVVTTKSPAKAASNDRRRTVVGYEDEPNRCNIQTANCEQPRRQRTVRMLPPPLQNGKIMDVVTT